MPLLKYIKKTIPEVMTAMNNFHVFIKVSTAVECCFTFLTVVWLVVFMPKPPVLT